MSNKILHVAKWEFFEKVRTKAFVIGLFLMPVIIGTFTVLPGLLSSKADEKTKIFGVIDRTGKYADTLNAHLAMKFILPNGRPNYELVPVADEDTALAHLTTIGTARVNEGTIDALLIIPQNVETSGKVELRAQNVGNIRDQERLSKMLEDIITQRRLAEAGVDAGKVRSLMRSIDVKTIKVSEKGEGKESGFLETFFSGYIFIMMLMFLVMTSGQMLVRSFLEEKSNRIVEVLMSSCSAKELMTGKILGLTLLGITTVAVWVLILVGVNLSMGKTFISVDHLALMIAYFVLGYLFFAAVFIAAGAPVSTEQEAQQVTSYVVLVLVFPIALAIPAMQNPDSLMVKILSLIPFLTPAMMLLRLSIQMPALWEIVLSLGLLTLSAVLMMWAASKIFRIGILITGKKPDMKEIWRWLRME